MMLKAFLMSPLLPAIAYAAAGGNCTASSLEVGAMSYNCTKSILGGGAALHWTVPDADGGSVHLAVERTGEDGWVALGFPDPASSSKMIGAHAIVAKGSETMMLNLASTTSPFPAVNASDMRVEFSSAESVVQDGKTIIMVSMRVARGLARILRKSTMSST